MTGKQADTALAEPKQSREARQQPVPAERAMAGIYPAVVLAAGADAQSFSIRAEGDTAAQRARTADSCMICPSPGDLVLCTAYPQGDGIARYILSVLVRADISTPARMNIAGGLTVEAPDGPLTLQAAQAISLLGGSAMNLAAETLNVRAEAGIFNLDSALLESDDAVARIGTMRLLGDKLLSLVKVISGHHQRASRKVEEVDQVQAQEVVVNAERLISHNAHQIVHVSTEDMRFDGARIHMG